MRPQTGKTVDVKVKSLLKNGDTITDYKTLRIEDLGKLIGKINGFGCGKKCWVNLKKNELQNSKISIELSNVMFNWEFKVKSFRIKQLGESQIINFQGNKIDLKSFKKLKNLKKGDKIQIFDIRFSSNANIRAKTLHQFLLKLLTKQSPSSSTKNWHSCFGKYLVLACNQNRARH